MNQSLQQNCTSKREKKKEIILDKWMLKVANDGYNDNLRIMLNLLSLEELSKAFILKDLMLVKEGKLVRSRRDLCRIYGVGESYVRTLGKMIGLYK